MIPTSNTNNKRWYWLDWVRIMAINMVILYHTIEGVLNYRKKGPISRELNSIRTYMQSVGLPLFFIVSGMVKGLKNNNKYNLKLSRIYYLIIPLLISTISFYIPSLYIRGKMLHLKNGVLFTLQGDCNLYGGNKQQCSFIEWQLFYFWKTCFIHAGFGWLWFLPMLTILELLTFPFIKLMVILMEQTRKDPKQKKHALILILYGVVTLLYYGLLRWNKQWLFIIIVIMIHCVLLFGIKIYYGSSIVWIKFISLIIMIFCIIPFGMIFAILFLDIRDFANEGEEWNAFDHAVDYDITYLYYWMFHLFGVVFTKIVYHEFVQICKNSVNSENKSKLKSKLSEWLNWFKIIGNHFVIVIIFGAISIKTEKHDRAYTFVNIFQEPNNHHRCMFLVSCWILIYAICMTARYTMNNQFNDIKNQTRVKKIYKSSLIVYCCHGLFIECLTFGLYDGLKDYEQFTSRLHIYSIYSFTVFLSYLFAFGLLKINIIAYFLGVSSIPKIHIIHPSNH